MEYYFTYFIVFKSNDNSFSGPIVSFRNSKTAKKNNNATMHLLDDDLNGMILSILVDTFISKISFPMQPGPEIGSISDA